MKAKNERTLLVIADKTFRITVPADAKITFGPWSPGKKDSNPVYQENNIRGGTLRVYDSDKNIICCFSSVQSFRDTAINYAEQVAKEEGATIWKSDQNGYEREIKNSVKKEWVNDTKLIGDVRRKKEDVF